MRCTAKLVRRFGLILDAPDAAEPANLLGDWYAKPLNVGTKRWVLCLSERSNLPVFVPATNSAFPKLFPEELRKVLLVLGVPSDLAELEVQRSSEFRFGKPVSRRMVASLNQMAYHADFELRRWETSVIASAALSEMPCRLNNVIFPGQEIFSLLGIPQLYDRQRNAGLLSTDSEDEDFEDVLIWEFPYPSSN